MQRVASYINEMITTLKRQEGFTKQSAEYQTAMVELNMADDYFKAREQIAQLERLKHEMEKEVYSLKHELVTTQMKLEAANKELAAAELPDRRHLPGMLRRVRRTQVRPAAQSGQAVRIRNKIGGCLMSRETSPYY